MKKGFLTLLLAGCSFMASSQVIRVGLGGFTSLGSTSGGIGLGGELAYAPQPKLDVGVHLGIGIGTSDVNSESVDAGLRYGVHSRYYLMKGTFKPYVGLMATMFSGGALDVSQVGTTPTTALKGKNTIGATPLVGIKLGPLNVNVGYTLGGGAFKGLNTNFGLLFGFGKFKD